MAKQLRNIVSVIAIVAMPSWAYAQADTVRAELVAVNALPSPGIVAATVGGKTIDSGEVNRLVKQTLLRAAGQQGRSPGSNCKRWKRSSTAGSSKRLDKQKITVTEGEIDKELIERQKAQRKRDSDLADVRGRFGMTEEAFREEVKWELRWAKFVRQALTDKALEVYFDLHRNEYDGTESASRHRAPARRRFDTRGNGPADAASGSNPRRDHRRAHDLRRGGQEILERAESTKRRRHRLHHS